MKSALFVLFALIFALNVEAKTCRLPIKIAVLDTGFGFNNAGHEAHLCQYGHKDFSSDRQFTKDYVTKDMVPLDTNSHGTNIVGLIEQNIHNVNYCIVIIKYYSDKQSGFQNLLSTVNAIQYATDIHADFINYSGGGPSFDEQEHNVVMKYLNSGGKLVAAAGNENQNIDLLQNRYYPASYDNRIIVVGNMGSNGVKCNSSNYGNRITRWEMGENVTAYGITLTGTSQATAIATGKIVSETTNQCDIGF